MMKQALATFRRHPRHDPGNSDLDPAKLSATLRALAMRAHQLVRTVDGAGPGVENADRELKQVHAELVRLQRSLGAHQLDDLATYVSALRERVEECLA